MLPTAGTVWFDPLNKLPMCLEVFRELDTEYISYKKKSSLVKGKVTSLMASVSFLIFLCSFANEIDKGGKRGVCENFFFCVCVVGISLSK